MTVSKDIMDKLQRLTVKPTRPKGLGDSMAAVLNKFGIKSCESCKKRQEVLNKIFPYQRNLFK